MTLDTYKSIFNSHYQGLCFFAEQYLHDTDSAEDIVQEIFVSLWENKNKLKGIKNFKSFLYTSVRNACFNLLKHEKVKDAYQSFINSSNDVLFDPQIIEEEVYIRLYNEIENLPEQCSNVMLLSLEGLKNAEIAEKLNLSVNTIKTQKKLGMSKLKAKLDIFKEYLPLFVVLFS